MCINLFFTHSVTLVTSLSLHATVVFSSSMYVAFVNLEADSKRDKLKMNMLYKY